MVEAARADLAEKHAYVCREADETVADRYVARVDKRIRALDQFPRRGSPRPDLGHDVRALSFERRLLIIYRIEGDLVRVLRILDGFRDLRAIAL